MQKQRENLEDIWNEVLDIRLENVVERGKESRFEVFKALGILRMKAPNVSKM